MAQKPTYEELEQRVKKLEQAESERKKAEKALRESEGRFRDVSYSMADWIWEVDKNARFTYASGKVMQILGYDPEELIGKTPFELMPDDEAKRIGEVFKSIASDKKPIIDLENWCLTKNGQSVCLLTNGVPLLDEEGELLGYRGVDKDITERKQAEEALQESKKRYKTIFNTVPVSIILIDKDGQMVDINPYHITQIGKGRTRKEDYIGVNLITHPSIVNAGLSETYRKVVEGESFDQKYVYFPTLTGGTDGYFNVKGGPIFKNDEVVGAVTTHEDITERVQAEKALRESEEKHRSMVESMKAAMYICSPDFRIQYMNPAMIKRTGRDATGEVCHKAINELDEHCPWCVHDKILQGETAETEILSPRDKRYYNVSHSPIFHQDGSISKMTIYRDRTKSKKAEEERIRLATAVKYAAESVIIADRPGTIQYVNPSFERLSGYAQEEIVGQNFRILKSDKHDENFYKEMWEIISKGNVWAGRITNRMKGGILREFETRISPVRDSSGEIINFVSVNRDVTQEVALETKLLRAQKMESLGLLAGGVAHDLNNVLSGIVSYPELILMDLPEDSKLRKPIETMQEAGHRAAAIVQDLLTMARGVAITKEPLNLNDLVGDYLNSPELEKLEHFHPTVTVKTNLDSDLFNVNGSNVHIRKVVMNLVSNAAEAIQGRGNVTILTMNRYVDRPLRGYDNVTIGEYAVLSVSDDGLGISSVDLERIFEPFYTKKIMGKSGTGLGLAVVWNVVQDHKGYINVVSNENGTTFELYFPITREKILSKDLAIPIEGFKGDGETILVVDDVESQREIACKMLETLGYKSDAVSSGEEAVEYLTEHTVDLILLDMIMDPGINGRETYERIIKIHPNQKAVIASGFAETDEVKEAQRLGAGQHIKKPLTLEKMGIAVRNELKK